MRENESPFSEATRAEAPRARRARKRGEGDEKRAKPSRSERTADKRERILKAAIKVFARKGFYAARVSEIAKAAGVADGTIYLYFRNKDDVLTSVFESRITRLVEVLREIVSSGGAFEDRFTRIVELQLGVLEGRRDLAEVVTVNLRQSSKLLKQFAAPFFVQYLEVMAGLIAEAQRDGAVRSDLSPRLVARSLWGALDGIALTWAIGGGEAGQLARAAPQVASLFLEGMRARRELRAIPRANAANGGLDDA